MVAEKTIIIEAPPESLLLAGPFPGVFPAADMKLGAFLLLAGSSSCDSNAQL
jgi:hypothetical protein